MKNKLFGFPGGDWSKKEFDEAIRGLIEKGLAEKVLFENKEYFQLTAIGEVVGKHMTSNSCDRN